MHAELILRFAIGGIIVSSFAFLGDLFKPKSFAGLFGGAPSVALATLGIAILEHGRSYAASEAGSMIAGAAELIAYACCLGWAMLRRHWPSLRSATLFIPVWLATALGLWWVFLR